MDELHEIKSRLDTKPEEADFNKVIAGAKGDEQVKSSTARIIPAYVKQFPKLEKAAVDALKALAGDASVEVTIYALKGLKEFFTANDAAVSAVVYKALANEDEHVVDVATKLITEQISNDEEFKKAFIGQIKDQEDQSQVKMVQIAREKYQFTEENVDELLGLIEVCFDSCVEEGLKLLRYNKKIIADEKKEPLVTKLINNLSASLDSDFENVTGSLLTTIMFYIPSLGQAGKILGLVAEKVLPKFETISTETKIKILQLIADNAKEADDPIILENLYNKVYLTFPKAYDAETKINFSLFEATLYAFFNLARRFSRKASEITGELLVITGQPNENEGITESADKKEEFIGRLKNVDPIAEKFVTYWKTKLEASKENQDILSQEEKKAARREAKIAVRTGNNVRHFCRILQLENFLAHRPPADVSWRKPPVKDSKKGGKNGHKNDKSSKGGKFHSKDRRGGDKRGGRPHRSFRH
jgi:hypothetical protein